MDIIDSATGITLTPSYYGKKCQGNGEHEGIECCCDQCDYFLTCFPDYNDPNHIRTYGDQRDWWAPVLRDNTCLECKHRGAFASPKSSRLYCPKTKRYGREFRAFRCDHFELDETVEIVRVTPKEVQRTEAPAALPIPDDEMAASLYEIFYGAD